MSKNAKGISNQANRVNYNYYFYSHVNYTIILKSNLLWPVRDIF